MRVLSTEDWILLSFMVLMLVTLPITGGWLGVWMHKLGKYIVENG